MLVASVCVTAIYAGSVSGATAQTPPSRVPQQIVGAFDNLFAGPHEGRRAVHGNGIMLEGSFVPGPNAARLSRAVHLNGGPVPVLVRFSDFAAVPSLSNGAPEASPRGMAVRFMLPDGGDTDLVLHSYNGFPAATPDDFLAFLRSLPNSAVRDAFAARHPAARRFLDAPKPTPVSYATEAYFGVNAFRFTNAEGQSRYARYRVIPHAGQAYLSPSETEARAPDFLITELAGRLAHGRIRFTLVAQLAVEGDDVADGSVAWPSDRPTIELGTISLRAFAQEGDAAQRALRFVPTNLVGGIAPGPDPMLAARTQAYRVSADRRGAE
ncbi:catalase family peroxidase [Paracraurococcus lichenis]|uniref:Catalase-related peroxidase n=1 Tax=Paracraurococcus lichenis TaxID=3064888 RepID=A0ABT9EEG2_9PROT|nr:catalase family peroxidase [Paracraurococcus sp. LOR1-02]MDO9714383.1 catalase family peroxidase [Paracraurococcus sp. LOR1-02]